MKKNIIISSVIVLLAIVVCVIAINPSSRGDNYQNNEQASVNGEDASLDKNPLVGKKLKFKTKDLNGNVVDENVFKENEVTILNLWSVNCGPCVKELPELDRLSKEFKGKVKVLGIVGDFEKEDAKEIVKSKKVSYPNLIVNKELEEQVTKHFDYVPVTLFVDKDGKVIDTFIPGGSDYNGFKSIVESIIK